MDKRELGTSGIPVSVVGLGCWPLGGGPGWGDIAEKQAIATIQAALDHGITFFDTAEGYNAGNSERVLGRALRGKRDRAVIATKISPSNTAPDTLRAHCEASLQRLQTDWIDLYQIHWPMPNERVPEALATLEELQAEGKIRAIGISNHGVSQMHTVLQENVTIVANQLAYNLLCRAIEFEILPLCQQHDISTIPYMPLMQGLLAGRYESPDDVPPFRARSRHFSSDRPQARHGEPGAEKETFQAIAAIRETAQDLGVPMAQLSIAWLLERPGVATVIAGARETWQVEANVAAASLELEPDTVEALDRATAALKRAMGANADIWQGDERRRTR